MFDSQYCLTRCSRHFIFCASKSPPCGTRTRCSRAVKGSAAASVQRSQRRGRVRVAQRRRPCGVKSRLCPLHLRSARPRARAQTRAQTRARTLLRKRRCRQLGSLRRCSGTSCAIALLLRRLSRPRPGRARAAAGAAPRRRRHAQPRRSGARRIRTRRPRARGATRRMALPCDFRPPRAPRRAAASQPRGGRARIPLRRKCRSRVRFFY